MIPTKCLLYLCLRFILHPLQLSFFLAKRLLLRQRGVFAGFIIRLAVLATTLSVAVMILALAFINGFKHTIREKLFSFWGEMLIVPPGADQTGVAPADAIPLDTAMLAGIAREKEVKQVAPFILRPVILQVHGQMEGVQLKGINQDFQFSPEMDFSGSRIHYPAQGYSQDIVLSRSTAEKLDIAPGDQLLLYFLESGASRPRARKVTLAGTYHTGMEEVDKSFGLCDLRLLQRLANWEAGEISGYQVSTRPGANLATLSQHIDQEYVARPLRAMPVYEVYYGIFSWLQMQDVNALVLLFIVAIVAVINLSATLIILLADRAQMVALLKALGATPRQLRDTFILLGLLISATGIVLGNVLGLGIAWLQQKFGFITLPEETYYMHTAPVRIVAWQVAATSAGALLLCLICLWLPTLYIRRIQPAKVLKFE